MEQRGVARPFAIEREAIAVMADLDDAAGLSIHAERPGIADRRLARGAARSPARSDFALNRWRISVSSSS